MGSARPCDVERGQYVQCPMIFIVFYNCDKTEVYRSIETIKRQKILSTGN